MKLAPPIACIVCTAIAASGAWAAPQVDAEAVFAELLRIIEREHACANTRDVDLHAAADAAVERLGENPVKAHVIQEMQRLVATLGDGHAGIEEFESTLPPVFMPVLLARADHGIVAFNPDRSVLLDADRPYVKSIDHVPIGEWLDAANDFVPAGSPQLVEERSLRLLRFIGFMRAQLGLPASETIWIELDEGNGDNVSRRLQIIARKPIFGEWPRTESRTLADDIGYLRLGDMSVADEELDGMQRFVERCISHHAIGLIIDVRGNSGGSRDALHALLPSFMPREPMIVNVAKRRLQPDELDGAQRLDALANRGLFPAAWPGWSDAERRAIGAFATSFQTKSDLPLDVALSDWHYTIVSRMVNGEDAPVAFAGPVVVLIDNVCFSASDVFAAAFAQLPNVTLVGTPTAGGSARAQPHRLRTIDATVRIGTMYSFQPTGEPYDGVGVVPDVLVYPGPTYFVNGGADLQLEKAIELVTLRGQADQLAR